MWNGGIRPPPILLSIEVGESIGDIKGDGVRDGRRMRPMFDVADDGGGILSLTGLVNVDPFFDDKLLRRPSIRVG